MDKILLTKSEIKKEYNLIFSKWIFELFLVFIFTVPTLIGTLYLFFADLDSYMWILWGFLVFLLAFLIIVAIYSYITPFLTFLAVMSNNFSVETAVLGNKQRRIGYLRRRSYNSEPYHPHALYFPDNRVYEIPEEVRFYKWTNCMKMSTDRLFETSDIGEEFYLVTVGKKRKRIILVYNTQYFEFKE